VKPISVYIGYSCVKIIIKDVVRRF
jgi:hypothetical protein